MKMFLLALLLAVFASANVLHAGQTRNSTSISNITGTGGRAIAMGGAFIALADDATAASWNPAGLAQLSKPELSLVFESVEGTLDASTEYRRYRPDLSVSEINRSLYDRTEFDDSQIGFASATFPFKAGSRNVVTQVSYRRMANFPDFSNLSSARFVFPGNSSAETYDTGDFYNSTFDGGIDAFSLSAAGTLFERVRLGLTANYLTADVQNRETYGAQGGEAEYLDTYLSSYEFSGVSLDFGFLYQPHETFSIGAVYHTGFESDFDYSNRNVVFDFGLTSAFAGVRGSSTVRWPSGWGMGVAFRPLSPLTFSADYTHTSWSDAFIDSYDDHFAYYDAERQRFVEFVLRQEHAAYPQLYSGQSDTSSIRIGTEYVLFAGDFAIPIRGGYFQEDQLASFWDADPPTFDGYSVGLGVSYRGVQIDAAWVKTSGQDQASGRIEPIYNQNSQVTSLREVVSETLDVSSERLLITMMYRF